MQELSYYYTESGPEEISEAWLQKSLEAKQVLIEWMVSIINNPDHRLSTLKNPPRENRQTMSDDGTIGEQFQGFEYNSREDSEPIHVSIDEIENRCKLAGVYVPKAFEEIKKHMPEVARFIAVGVGDWSGYNVIPHFHSPILKGDGSYNRDCRTITVVIPMNHSVPVEEDFIAQYVEYSKEQEEELQLGLIKEFYLYYKDDSFSKTTVKMPAPGQYLVLDFNSSKILHWLENNNRTKNEYLCLVAEC